MYNLFTLPDIVHGKLKLLPRIRHLYKDVDEDAQRVRDLYTDFEKQESHGHTIRISTGTRPLYGNLKVLLNKYTDAHRILEGQLREKIRKVLEQDWFKKKS